MPRPPSLNPSVPWKVHVPATQAGKIELLLLDRARGKPLYGARNTLIVKLLDLWIESYQRGEMIVNPFERT